MVAWPGVICWITVLYAAHPPTNLAVLLPGDQPAGAVDPRAEVDRPAAGPHPGDGVGEGRCSGGRGVVAGATELSQVDLLFLRVMLDDERKVITSVSRIVMVAMIGPVAQVGQRAGVRRQRTSGAGARSGEGLAVHGVLLSVEGVSGRRLAQMVVPAPPSTKSPRPVRRSAPAGRGAYQVAIEQELRDGHGGGQQHLHAARRVRRTRSRDQQQRCAAPHRGGPGQPGEGPRSSWYGRPIMPGASGVARIIA